MWADAPSVDADAMENAQPILKETADFITRSNDEDGILHVIDLFMR